MVDRDITISNLETNIRWIEDIPSHQFPGWGNVTMAMRDAVELLKEQEAVEPKEIINEHVPIGDYRRTMGWLCGKCGKTLMGGSDYCSYCGQAVKWND